MNASDRLSEAAKQTTIARDDLAEDADPEELPEGVVEEIGELSERLRRVKNALREESA